jgi:hypothetical protein
MISPNLKVLLNLKSMQEIEAYMSERKFRELSQ